jgi:dTDP-4-dehydrorhamnose reductase
MHTLIIGSAGQVGGALLERLGAEARGADLAPAGPEELRVDIGAFGRDPEAAARWVGSLAPRVVHLVAAWTWVDGCEGDPARAFLLNRDAAAALAAAARRAGARSVFYSTEYVFDGARGPYREDDPTHPVSVYGRSKLEAEGAVRAADPDALILRTTVVYGPEAQGKNFAYQLAERLGAGQRMRVPADQISTPTYNRDLADAAVRLVASGARGVVHVTGEDLLDRAEFARRLARAAGLDAGLIDAVPTAALGQKAARPLRAGLRIDRLRTLAPGFRPRSVEAAVADWRERPRGKRWPSG